MQTKSHDPVILALQTEINLLLGFANSASPTVTYEKIQEEGIWGPRTKAGLLDALKVAGYNPSRRGPLDEAYARAWVTLPELTRIGLPPPRKSMWDLEAEKDGSLRSEELIVRTELRLIKGAFVATATVTALGTVFRSKEWTHAEASRALELAIGHAVAAYARAAPAPAEDALGDEFDVQGAVPDEAFEL